MYDAINKKYGEGYLVLGEVRWGTGFGSHEERRADAIVISMWPSRGVSITGFEVKTSRSDWLSELKNPFKNDGWVQFCDYWYLVTNEKSIAKLDEIPEPWGWMSGEKRLRTLKKAPKRKNPHRDKATWISLMRRAMEITDGDRKNIELGALGRAREQAEKELAGRRSRLEREEEFLKNRGAHVDLRFKELDAYREELGMHSFDAKRLAEVCAYWQRVDLRQAKNQLESLELMAGNLRKKVEEVDDIFNKEEGHE